jgi:hypothetical protein
MYTPDAKDTMRVSDIVKKSHGDHYKIESLATTMAGRITEPRKVVARAIAADELARKAIDNMDIEVFTGLLQIVQIFLDRAEDLGVTRRFRRRNSKYKFCQEDAAFIINLVLKKDGIF